MGAMTKSQATTLMVLLALVLGSSIAEVALVLRSNPVHLSQPVELSEENAAAYPVFLSQPVELSKADAPAWEYRIEAVPDLAWDTIMSELGADGWELVFARRAQDANDKMMYETIFKRQKRG